MLLAGSRSRHQDDAVVEKFAGPHLTTDQSRCVLKFVGAEYRIVGREARSWFAIQQRHAKVFCNGVDAFRKLQVARVFGLRRNPPEARCVAVLGQEDGAADVGTRLLRKVGEGLAEEFVVLP